MSTQNDIIAAVQAEAAACYAASATEGAAVMVALGKPGTTVTIADQKLHSGSAWGGNKTMQVLLGGVATYMDTLGLSGIESAHDKINELVAAYTQLRADYNASVVPTTAPAVLPLP